MDHRTVITLGSFDGVHRGHQALVRHARDVADAAPAPTSVVAMTFDPHPATALRPERAPARLTSLEQRTEWLVKAGADRVIRLEPTPELLSLAPEAFVEQHLVPLHPIAMVEGTDFRFGHKRVGDIEQLLALGQAHGFDVVTPGTVETDLEDQTVCAVSSTMIRWLLAQGRVRDGERMLGRPYELRGTVIQGDRRGREIGYPTANLQSSCMMPGDGIYGGEAQLDDGRSFVAAISVGTKPTFNGVGRAVEAYLLDVPRTDGEPGIDGLPEYGWTMRLTFLSWIRDQVRFASLEPLLEQMSRDCATVRETVATWRGRNTDGELASCH